MVNLKEFEVDKLILLISIMRQFEKRSDGIALKNKLDEILQKTSTPNSNKFIQECKSLFTNRAEEFIKYITIRNSDFIENLQPIFDTNEFKTLYEETLKYKEDVISRWNVAEPKVNQYFSQVLGISEEKDIVVNIVNPKFSTGTNNMNNKIFWGHYEGINNPNYDAVYMMHEAMHCMFPYKKEWNEEQIGICHSLIELAIDNELMSRLNGDSKFYNTGHSDGTDIRNKLKPVWDKFLKGKTDNKNFEELMQYCTENYKKFDDKKFLSNNTITKMFDYLKHFISRMRNKSNAPMLLAPPKEQYTDIIKRPQIATIIDNMPKNLSNMEKAYYVYIELGKIVSESPYFVFTDRAGKEEHYNDPIDEKYYGNCKSIAELYVSILKDNRIGISADLVKEHPGSSLSHIDTILKIDGKNYIANLISDLSKIKHTMRVNSFGFDLERMAIDPEGIKHNHDYLERLKEKYGKIDILTRGEREKLDEKIGYVPQFSKGFYTEDKIPVFKTSMEQYLAQKKDVPEELRLKYKLDYVFENITKLTNNNNANYLENIRFYLNVANKMLEPDEKVRIHSYAATVGDDVSNIISILKVKPLKKSEKNNNLYYQYSNKDKKYVGKTPEQMLEFLNGVDKKSLKIIGTFDRPNPKGVEELELE